MNSVNVQLWVVGVCVALALGYTVWGAVRNVKRVQAGGAACGGCAGDACGSGAGCGGGATAAGSGGGGAAGQPGAAAATTEHPVHWLPPSAGSAGKSSSGSR
jgi:hypothetical protein